MITDSDLVEAGFPFDDIQGRVRPIYIWKPGRVETQITPVRVDRGVLIYISQRGIGTRNSVELGAYNDPEDMKKLISALQL